MQIVQNENYLQAETEKPKESRYPKICLAMKELQMCQMEIVNGGLKFSTMTGILCGSAAMIACFGFVLAPLAAAPAVGCAAFLAAQEYWESQGIEVE